MDFVLDYQWIKLLFFYAAVKFIFSVYEIQSKYCLYTCNV